MKIRFLVVLIGIGIFFSRLGATPLTDAAREGDFEQVKLLLESGVDVNEKENGSTALMAATFFPKNLNQNKAIKLKIVKLLIQRGAKINLMDPNGDSAITLATSKFQNDILRELIKAKAILDLKNTDGHTALMVASYVYNIDAIKILIKAKANLNIKNNEDETVLQMILNDKKSIESDYLENLPDKTDSERVQYENEYKSKIKEIDEIISVLKSAGPK